ncbi:MAG: uncharacterized protein QOG48_2302, partial [Verrucomicrobiota bacterium]
VFVSKDQMTRAFGLTNLRTVGLATLLGAASSSCSYAAVAAARSAFRQGATLTLALAFMFASTNLVVELGMVLWVLMGWQFVLAEITGALVLIAMMWLLMSIFFPRDVEADARDHAKIDNQHSCDHDHASPESAAKWTQMANAFWMDWSMLWKEIFGGFLIAGCLSALVPADWWKALFIQSGNEWLRLIENAAVGPLIALASFVCSVGNIPLASLLWANGISFGGVIAFIYGDLIVVPIILIYFKYYGARAATRITLILYASMVIAGVIVDLAFTALNLIPRGPRPISAMEHATVQWNYTAWLNVVAILVCIVLWLVKSPQDRHQHSHS